MVNIKELQQNALNICLNDFKKRGVGYCILEGLEFNFIMNKDLKTLNFKVFDSITDTFKILKVIKPTKEQINKYKSEFL